MQPREYQSDAVEAAWQTCMRGRNPLIVVPTGGGKSVIIAELIRKVLDFGGRVVVLAHRKELLQQNAEKIEKMVGVQVGVYSAGLKSKDVKSDVVVAGIQSVYKHAHKLDRRHFVIIDEAHLIPADKSTMYGQFLGDMAKYNPKLFVVGLTATPYRTGEGDLTSGKLFDETAYECSLSDLIDKGYLSELITRPGSV
ncbi:MAG: DEAD/DEAH box helicase family protein, partial [Proteobacteria bacterium]|nr:DEAD/DEAH box helicase family protein [Pseudomonadota bacterium]